MTQLLFPGVFSFWMAIGLAVVASIAVMWLYRRDVRFIRVQSNKHPLGVVLPWLRGAAVFLLVMMLAEPTLQHRYRESANGKLTIVVDDSRSMTLDDNQTHSRFQRATNGLLDRESQLLERLADEHDLRVIRGSSEQIVELTRGTIRDALRLPSSPDAWMPKSFSDETRLGDWLARDDSTAIVLLTDGHTNAGASLRDGLQQRADKPTLFAVGYGADDAPRGMRIVGIEHPDRVFQHDKFAGKVTLTDTGLPGQGYRLQAIYGDEIFWEQSLRSEGNGQRAIAFSFPIADLIDDESNRNESEPELRSAGESTVKSNAVAVDLRFRLLPENSDESNGEDERKVSFWGVLHRTKVLLVDGRSRWETRYLKNLFERDPYWELQSVIARTDDLFGRGVQLPNDSDGPSFPADREELLDFDLVILGDLPRDLLSLEQQEWLLAFVAESGGGAILIDGQRGGWSQAIDGPLANLLPVKVQPPIPQSSITSRTNPTPGISTSATDVAISNQPASHTYRFVMTPSGEQVSALDLRDDEAGSPASGWSNLPVGYWSALSEPLPGTEVLARLESNTATDRSTRTSNQPQANPFMVSRILGAGRVLYLSSDETWRWRYRVADKIHQRFWNQISRWVMRTPYVATNEFVSLDAGAMNYRSGQSVEVRCRLRNGDRSPLKEADVQAIIERDGGAPIAVRLTPDEAPPGTYRASVSNLEAGEYSLRVSAAGIPNDTLGLSTRFIVQPEVDLEMTELAVNRDELQRVSESTGGSYLSESELPNLAKLLKPLSQGRIVEEEIPLWPSFTWFIPVLVLLTAEWLIRKHVGLA